MWRGVEGHGVVSRKDLIRGNERVTVFVQLAMEAVEVGDG